MDAVLHGPLGQVTLGSTPLTVGRAQDNQLVLLDAKASGHHAEIRWEGQGYSIVDLESTNGTFVNQQRIERNHPHHLKHLDLIRIGGTTLTYEVRQTSVHPSPFYGSPSVGDSLGYQSTVLAPPPTAYGIGAMQNSQTAQNTPLPLVYVPLSQQSIYTPLPRTLDIPDRSLPLSQGSQKKRPRVKLTPSIVGGITLLVLAGCGLLVFVVLNAISGPSGTLNAYCNALKNQNYQTAYNQLDQTSHSKFSLASFTQYVTENNGAGHVVGCTVSGVNMMNMQGTGAIDYMYANGSRNSMTYTLNNQGSSWKITNVIASTPDMTLKAYCDALSEHAYPLAYSQFSTEFKSVVSESDFANRFRAAGINSCQYADGQSDGATATATITYKDAHGNTVEFAARLISEDEMWKIDSQQQM